MQETIIQALQNPFVVGVLVVWELIWKSQALWKSARNSEKYWFAALLVVNSLGILPIIYLVLRKKHS